MTIVSQLQSLINTLEDLGTSFSSNSTFQWKKGPNFSIGKKCLPEAYKAALHNPKVRKKIENFLMRKFPENSDGVNQAYNKLTEIMCKAAKLSLTTKRHVKKYKHPPPPPPQEKGLIRSVRKQARISFKKSANAANRDPSDFTLVQESSEKLKEFKKICKVKQNEYWEKKNDKLFSTNDESFWSVWKQCDGNIAPNKNPMVCEGEKWKTYYANLFSNPIGKNKNCPTISNHKKVSKENSIFLNKPTSHQEFKKILNILKNGKSPGVMS